MEKRWFLKSEVDQEQLEKFRNEVKCHPILAKLLLQRGIDNYDSANEFFNPSLDSLHDPFLMKNMNHACLRLTQAIQQNEKILLFGDYDVDGTTAVALMYSFLTEHSSRLDFYIPDRYTEGYGISSQGIDYAHETGVHLIISLDCGIRATEQVAKARSLGIDFIVCDHHEPGTELPDAILLDPKQKDCAYPFKGLSGCGVGFKLLQSFCVQQELELAPLYKHLDLLAVSIGADIVDITGENRVLAHAGLEILNRNPRFAFRELVRLAGRQFPLTLSDIVFTIAPRINAAGRLRSGRHAVALLISENEEEITAIATEIDEDNRQRRGIDQQITKEAVQMIESDSVLKNSRSLVLFNAQWHKGVVGIVASRLVERYFKPTIVLTESNGKIAGSARTVNDFDIHAAICKCERFLDQFGGHCHAAGLTMSTENLEAFRSSFEEEVAQSISQDDLTPTLYIDAEMSFSELFQPTESLREVPKLKRQLMRFEPHGPGNLQPVFMTRNLYAVESSVLKNEHLKLQVIDPASNISLPAIAFNLAGKSDLTASGLPVDLVYTLSINKWNGKENIQLQVRDLRSSV
jgi:single-stranded-DNA-specific exonuclease